VDAYYDYAIALTTYFNTKAKWDRYEAYHPNKLWLRVTGVDLSEKPDVAFPCQPDHQEEDQDKAAVDAIKPLEKGILAKVTVANVGIGFPFAPPMPKAEIKHEWETNEGGYLFVKHFRKGELITIKAEAEGYKPAYACLRMLENTKKEIHLEKHSAAVKTEAPAPAPQAPSPPVSNLPARLEKLIKGQEKFEKIMKGVIELCVEKGFFNPAEIQERMKKK